jgi:hypothetical protein
MKKYIKILALLSVILFVPLASNAQCKTFSKKVKIDLLPYVHDGIYNATVLSEGETVELYKTFYSGQEYRLVVAGDDKLPPVQFQVLDGDKNVLYDNQDEDYSRKWDFTLESSQMLIISIQVQTSDELADEIKEGCVSVLVGFMNVEDSFDQY